MRSVSTPLWLIPPPALPSPGACQRLTRQVEVFASWLVLPWDDDAGIRNSENPAVRLTPGGGVFPAWGLVHRLAVD